MFWKYFLFEAKILIKSKKMWLVALLLILFFPIYFMIYSQADTYSLYQEKYSEGDMMNSIFNYLQEDFIENNEELHQNLLEQNSIINFQKYYLGAGSDHEAYVESMLELNELRLEVHEIGYDEIPDHLIVPKEEVQKDDAIISYIDNNNIPLQAEGVTTNSYMIAAFTFLSGIFFYFIVLLSSSDSLIYERHHRTVMNGFPISFMKKILSKVTLHFLFIFTSLTIGTLLGLFYSSRQTDFGHFMYPVLFYSNGEFHAIATWQYLLLIMIAFVVITIFTLLLTLLLNLILKNAYATILVALGILLIPTLMTQVGFESPLQLFIQFIDITSVMSGELEMNTNLNYTHAITWLTIGSIILTCAIYIVHKLNYINFNWSSQQERSARSD
ncbi:hypothetical protein [Alkalibacillus haloalkaliphilus]|uniref:hypothetical protein n=1 Tax=Alkalibacillus haloalkaliphilus TaxID=94136 RepID=UPI00030D859F|nr:hypothetical protein [Alkalibacillus haloalkaliphilus]